MGDKKIEKKVKLSTVIWSCFLIFLFYLAAIGGMIYFFPLSEGLINNSVIRKTAKYVPYPAAIIGTKLISINDLLNRTGSVKKFYENQDFSDLGMRVDFSTEDGEKRLQIKERKVLGKLIEDAILESEAQKTGIKITNEIVDQEVDRKLKEYGAGEYLKENLEKLYGWSLDDFKENIVKPDLYKEKLFSKIRENDPSFKSAQEKIGQAQKDLKENMELGEVAKKYSEGSSSQEGGELGWFSLDQMLPEVALPVYNLEKGKNSDIIESSLGFHIIKKEDEKTENDVYMAKISQIFVRTQPFSEWLLTKEKEYNVLIPISSYQWNKEEGEVEFKRDNMIEYEKELMKNAPNDPSIIF